jgi:hypothetical protein
MAVVSTWLYVHLYTHPDQDARIGLAGWGLETIIKGGWLSFWAALSGTLGMFTVKGESVWLYNITGRPVFVGPEGWLFYLGVLMCLWRVRKPEYALQLIVIAIMLVPSFITENPPSWTRSIGILPALLVVVVLPVEWLWSRLESGPLRPSYRRLVLPLYALLVLGLGVSVYWRTAYDMLVVWMNHPGTYWMSLAFYDETAEYINCSSDPAPLNFNMPVYTPWRRSNLLRPIQRRDVALRLGVNNAFVFPDSLHGLRVAFQIYEPPAQALQAAFFDPAPSYIGPRADPVGEHPLRVYSITRARLDDRLARAQEGRLFFPYTDTPINSTVEIGEWLRFLGYELLNPGAGPGGTLNALTYWRVLKRPPEMAVFLHLLGQDKQLVAQYDGFDVMVEELAPGDIVVQLHALQLPPDLPPAEYRFQMGAYERDSLQRFPLSVDTADRIVWLQPWRLGPAGH